LRLVPYRWGACQIAADLPAGDWDVFIGVLMDPPEPSQALRDLHARYLRERG